MIPYVNKFSVHLLIAGIGVGKVQVWYCATTCMC